MDTVEMMAYIVSTLQTCGERSVDLVVMDLENELVGESAWRSVGWGGLTSPYDEIDVLVVVPPSSAPPGLVARSRRVVHLADADSVVPTAMLAELRASLPGLVGIFGEHSPAVAVASSIYSAGLPLVLFADEPVSATTG
jgi:hypothetical protein